MRIASISGLRGNVGDGLDPSVAVEFAASYASECESGPILVSHDGRVSASVFMPAVVSAVAATGHDVIQLGATATPTVGFLVRERNAAGGIQISASHNPPQYNGLKFFQKAGMVLGADQGRSVLDRWTRREFSWAPWDGLGQIHACDDPDEQHLARVLGTVDVEAIRARRFTVVLDACHGAGGRLGERLLRELGCRTLILGGQPDGRYDHPPEPTEANLKVFSAIVRASGADVGFAQDPDADRLAIVDESGRYIGEELTLALAVAHRLNQVQGPVVINLSTSRVVEDLASAVGCAVHRVPVGEINVVEGMLREKAVIGGEGNGGVIDPRVGFVRDSFSAMALVLDQLATTKDPLSSVVDRLPRYSMVKDQVALDQSSGSADSQSPEKRAALWDRIAETFPDARPDRRDGLRLAWDDRWVQVRASNTEPIVRVIAEAATFEKARGLADEVGRLVRAGAAENAR
jgi:phosphomannomutase